MKKRAAFYIDYLLDGIPSSGYFPDIILPSSSLYDLMTDSYLKALDLGKFLFEYTVAVGLGVDITRVRLINSVRVGRWVGPTPPPPVYENL